MIRRKALPPPVRPAPARRPSDSSARAATLDRSPARQAPAVESPQRRKFLEMHRRELRERAALLRRLGYTQAVVEARLSSYETWEYEPFHESPLSAEVASIVAEVFAKAHPRQYTLSPE
ncbi:MAG: hypothetical protein JNJ46_03010 [Myxococcales bacterium]|nr:hypothetical protein [Myxococcales bacterium]